jgi:hypothetical protein
MYIDNVHQSKAWDMPEAARRTVSSACLMLAIALCAAISAGRLARAQIPQSEAPGAVTRRIGAIKTINGNIITLALDSGANVNVTVQPNARVLRTDPGAKDLKNATPIQLQDLQVGDRVLVAGKVADDGSVLASAVVVMKLSDLEAKHQQELQDWQRRGIGGVVTSVDPSAGTVTISTGAFGAKKDVVIHASANTIIRRYAPDSVKFDDAKPSTLAEIHPGDKDHPGDQVRARGTRSPDGNDFTADEIVSGTFRNIAGTVNSVDASSSTVSVQDLLSKKSVTVKVTQDSQLHQLPAEMAQRIAMRLKRAALAGMPGSGSSPAGEQPGAAPAAAANALGENGGPRRPGGGAPDLQQMLNRLPPQSLTDLHKGDAVVVLATDGTAGTGSVVTLLTGVEPLLRAAPNASAAGLLTPWSLSMPAGDAGGP